MTALTHIAGNDATVNTYLRQRCLWCGTLLLDYNLALVAVPVGTDPRPATWAVGSLVTVDGHASYTVEHVDGDPLPDNACARIDPDVTR